jgi:multiple sugar transport system permease protein
MKFRTFAIFVGPSVVLMLLFVAAPLVSVVIDSFHVSRPVMETVSVEVCTPGFLTQTCTREDTIRPLVDAAGQPLSERVYVGLESYRQLIQPDVIAQAFSAGGKGLAEVLNIEFFRALRFTLTFTLITLPLVLGLGLVLAIAMNSVVRQLRGVLIFATLLPFIITPVIGALSIRWLFVGDAVLTNLLEWLTGRPIAMFAQGWTIEILMHVYRVWHVAPFAFIIFYAGLQTLDQDTLESAIVDGASRWERLRMVVIPHLAPLIIFVSLIHLMDAYRVFDEVIGFSSQAHVISLQYLTFNFLMPDQTGGRAVSRAAASSMLTMVGIVLLLIPLLLRTWRDHKRGR